MAARVVNLSLMEKAVDAAQSFLKFHTLKPFQREALTGMLQGRDIFVSQPTGSGKSAIYQLAPVPLISLIEDQMNKFSGGKIKVSRLRFERELSSSKTVAGQANKSDQKDLTTTSQIIFTSPEAVLDTHRSFLRSLSEIRMVAIDEAHCVVKWGSSSGKTQAFRESYFRLHEHRSLLQSKVPFVVLTATALPEIEKQIIVNLQLSSILHITASPDRSNIRYAILNTKTDEASKLFLWLLDLLKEKATENIVKSHIIESMTKDGGTVRVLIATTAFGMGVDCKNLHLIVHFGPPSDIDDYVQESGRAGRDGQPSNAVLIRYPRCTSGKRLKNKMKFYLNNKNCAVREIVDNVERLQEKQSLWLNTSILNMDHVTEVHGMINQLNEEYHINDKEIPKRSDLEKHDKNRKDYNLAIDSDEDFTDSTNSSDEDAESSQQQRVNFLLSSDSSSYASDD
eukprot:gene2017-2294_t